MSKNIILILVGVILIGFGVNIYTNNQANSESAKIATEQKNQAKALKSGVHFNALDKNTKSVDDFYQYANGGWLDSTEIPAIYSGYTVYHEVQERVETQLKKIIQQAADKDNKRGSEAQKIANIYRSYMDVDTINKIGLKAIELEFKIVNDISDLPSLSSAFAQLNKIGIGSPYSLSIYPDLKNSTFNIPYLRQSRLTLSNRDYYLDLDNKHFDKARAALPTYIRDLLVTAGKNEDDASTAAQQIVALETALATAQWDNVKNRDNEATYNPTRVSDLNKLGSNLDWSITREVLAINAAETIIINQPSYFEALDKMLNDIPLETWKNYLAFKVLDSRAQHLDKQTAEIRFNFKNRILRGQEEVAPRWKRGVTLVNSLIGEAVGKLYVEEYFPPAAKAKMLTLVDNVLATLDESIATIEWMSEATKLKAKEKLSKFTAKIGYPDVWTDYSDLKIVSGDHLANLRNAKEWEHAKEVAKLGKPVDKTEWHMTPQTVNAYYSPTSNEIVFPAARLQPPFFQLEADDAINYGAVGGVIGHEISHGFDDRGSRFDGDGNMINWWTDADRVGFEARTKVLIEQYSQFSPIEGMTVNGAFTLGENIGDLSGVAMAYRAYVKTLKGTPAPIIDDLTGAQRFFLGYAMSRKGKYKDESTISRLASDSHSPLKYRVNGPYRNIDAFHEAFGTKEGDGMWLDPKDRVKIW